MFKDILNITTGFEVCIKEFDTESYNGKSMGFIFNTDELWDRIEYATKPGLFKDLGTLVNVSREYGKYGRTDSDPLWVIGFSMYPGKTCSSTINPWG